MTHSTQKRKNMITLIVIGCLVAIAAIVTTTVLLTQNTNVPVVTPPVEEPEPQPPVTQTMQTPLESTEIDQGFANDKLVYSPTLKLWQTHEAIDFKAAKGTPVVCVLDGTVTTVASDPLNGTYVVVTHEDGKVTTYKSLEKEVAVKKGDKVKQGDKLGTVGDTMLSEAAQGAHLHFELAIDGKLVNPADYIDAMGGK